MIRLTFLILPFFLALIICHAQASTPNLTEEEALHRISELEHNLDLEPFEVIEQIETIVDDCEVKGFRKCYLKSSVVKLIMLVLVEDIPAAVEQLPSLQKLAQEMADKELIALLLSIELEIGMWSLEPDKILALITKVKQAANDVDNPVIKIEILMVIAQSYENLDYPYESIKTFGIAYDLAKDNKSQDQIGPIYAGLASAYGRIHDEEIAVDYYKKALDFGKYNKFDESIIRYNFGTSAIRTDNFTLAHEQLNIALNLSKQLDDDVGIHWTNLRLAELDIKQGNWDEALERLPLTLLAFEESGDIRSRNDALLLLTRAYIGKQNIEQASWHIKMLEKGIEDFAEPKTLANYAKVQSDILFLKGEFKASAELLRETIKHQEALTKQNQLENISRFRAQFDANLKETQNEALQQQNQINKMKIAAQEQRQLVWMVVLLLGILLFIVLLFLLYSQIKTRNEFRLLSLKDVLTNSPNRRSVIEFAQHALVEAKSKQSDLYICVIDLDNFKKLNDTYGHDTGDKVLIAFGKACEESIRDLDGFGRYGGEEWLLVLKEANKEALEQVFVRIRTYLNKQYIGGLPEGESITFSMGCERFSWKSNQTLNELISGADKKLYEAKRLGRNKIIL